jgi:hypothetical protein
MMNKTREGDSFGNSFDKMGNLNKHNFNKILRFFLAYGE